jgi:AcrR family transcriptional regulator
MKPEVRKEELLDAALALAKKHGYQNVTRNQIAEKVACAPSLIHHYFNTMNQLRRAIISAAIHQKEFTVLAQGLAAKEPKALAAPIALREAAAQTLIGA